MCVVKVVFNTYYYRKMANITSCTHYILHIMSDVVYNGNKLYLYKDLCVQFIYICEFVCVCARAFLVGIEPMTCVLQTQIFIN